MVKRRITELVTVRPMVKPLAVRAVKKKRVARKTRIVSGYSTVARVIPPAAAGSVIGQNNPIFRSLPSGVVFLCNTEMMFGITTTAAFASTATRLVANSLSWLNTIASNFSKYRWISLRYLYIPACPTSTSGSFSMGLQYDDQDTNPISVAAMSMNKGFTNAPIWAGWEGSSCLKSVRGLLDAGSVATTVDVAMFDKPWYPYINAGNLAVVLAANAASVNIYSPGVLITATEGGPATPVTSGYLYAQYEIEMIEPIAGNNNF